LRAIARALFGVPQQAGNSEPWSATRTCQPVENYYSRRMGKKSDAEPTAKTPRRKEKPDCPQMPQNPANLEKKSVQSAKSAEASSLRASTSLRLRSSTLLDTRVVYCGDNLEQPGEMQKVEGRMMKPAHSPILHSSFILLNSPLPASHYVKVMLDCWSKMYEANI